MADSWPSAFQEKLNEAGFTLQPGDVTLRSDMSVGPSKVRRVSTLAIDVYSGSINIDKDEYQPLMDFYYTTLDGGTLPFIFNHPITQVPSVFRFLGPPSITPLGGIMFRASMKWEYLYAQP